MFVSLSVIEKLAFSSSHFLEGACVEFCHSPTFQ